MEHVLPLVADREDSVKTKYDPDCILSFLSLSYLLSSFCFYRCSFFFSRARARCVSYLQALLLADLAADSPAWALHVQIDQLPELRYDVIQTKIMTFCPLLSI